MNLCLHIRNRFHLVDHCSTSLCNEKMRYNRRNAVTPLVRQAVIIQAKLFQILYPAPYGVKFTSDQFLNFYFDKITTKHLLWLSSLSLITFGCGWNSCVLILIRQLVFQSLLPHWVHWSFFATIISALFLVAATLEMLGLIGLIAFPQVMATITALQQLEQKCKFLVLMFDSVNLIFTKSPNFRYHLDPKMQSWEFKTSENGSKA